jgi:NitT/TauT family transport system permease protein
MAIETLDPSSLPRRLGGVLVAALRRYWAVAAIIVAWQAWVSLSGFNAIVLPQPGSVVADVVGHLAVYAAGGGVTLFVAASGLACGLAIGTLVAILAWSTPILSGMLTPLGLVFSSVPVVTLIPILARLLGYDIRTEIAVVAILSFFPSFVFTAAGLRALPQGSADLFAVLGARRWTRLRLLALPAALPHWMVALRIAAPQAVLAAMLAEFLMGTSGLGYMFIDAKARFDMDRVLGTSLVATVASILCFMVAARLERGVRERFT